MSYIKKFENFNSNYSSTNKFELKKDEIYEIFDIMADFCDEGYKFVEKSYALDNIFYNGLIYEITYMICYDELNFDGIGKYEFYRKFKSDENFTPNLYEKIVFNMHCESEQENMVKNTIKDICKRLNLNDYKYHAFSPGHLKYRLFVSSIESNPFLENDIHF